MMVDLVPLVLEALELGSHILRKIGDAAADLAVLSVGSFFFHVCVYVLHFLCEGKKKRSLPRSSSQGKRLTCP